MESLRLQAKIHNGLLSGGVEELVQAAYHRAKTLLMHLLATTAADTPNDLTAL